MFAACLLLCWRGVVSRIRSLVVLGVPSLSPPPFFLYFFFLCVLFFCILFFLYSFFLCSVLFLYSFFFVFFFLCVVLFFVCSFFFVFSFLFIFVSTELSGSSVTGALRGLAQGARGLVAGWAGQLGVLAPWGCDCGCSPQASWAPTLHWRHGR